MRLNMLPAILAATLVLMLPLAACNQGPEPTSPIPSDRPTATPEPAVTDTLQPTATPSPVPIPTATPTPTATPSPVPIPTATPTPTATPSPVPTGTPTQTPTATPSPVPTPTATPTATATSTPVPAPTAAPTPTATPSPVPTPTATPIPTATPSPVPTATPTATATSTPVPAPTAAPTPTATPVTFTEAGIYKDNIFVLPVSEDLTVDPTSTSLPRLPLDEYTRRFYEHFKDEFDFLMVARNLVHGVDTLAPCAKYIGVKNDVQGIGKSLFSNSERWGSSGRLQGVITFDYVGIGDPLWERWTPIGRGPGLHEVMHRWANFVVPSVDLSHWGFSSANGLLGGFDITLLEDHGNGQYTAGTFNTNGSHSRPFSPIELYLAGLAPPEEVPDLWVAEDGKWLRDGWENRPFTASRVKIFTIEDIIAEHGPRIPDTTHSQKEFRAAVILLVNEDHPANRRILEKLSEEATWISAPAFTDEGDWRVGNALRYTNFYESTGGRATLSMDGLSEFLKDGE